MFNTYPQNCFKYIYLRLPTVLGKNNNRSVIECILNNYEHDPTEDSWINVYLNCEHTTSDLKSDILTYIAGYIQFKVYRKTNCPNCYQFLKAEANEVTCSLITIKNRGGLQTPKNFINFIVHECDQILTYYMTTCDIYTQKNLMMKLIHASQKVILEKKTKFVIKLRCSCE